MIAVRDEEMPAATGRCPLPSIFFVPHRSFIGLP
jgi:hypothetical protein